MGEKNIDFFCLLKFFVDFRLARVLTQPIDEGGVMAQKTESKIGPIKWMAPESIAERKYSSKSDVWA